MRLHFEADVVRRLLRHSRQAIARDPAIAHLFDGRYRFDGRDLDIDDPRVALPAQTEVDRTKLPAGLFLVWDKGIYLMSNGLPCLLVDPGGTAAVVAQNLETDPVRNPGRWKDIQRSSVGEGDGHTFLDSVFIDDVLRAASNGAVCIDATPIAIRLCEPTLPWRALDDV